MLVRLKNSVQPKDRHGLRPGRAYVVYALLFQETLRMLVQEERDLSFPFFVDAAHFEVVDGRIPSGWRWGQPAHGARRLVAFDRMVNDPMFYERLVDGAPDARSAWESAKAAIDAEVGAETLDVHDVRPDRAAFLQATNAVIGTRVQIQRSPDTLALSFGERWLLEISNPYRVRRSESGEQLVYGAIDGRRLQAVEMREAELALVFDEGLALIVDIAESLAPPRQALLLGTREALVLWA
jgi:hypothetical protein